ncbi:MAG: NTP transferase domain-containing protein [Lutibacter sp.]|uniref:nucleotidyltransferase family protein n=1 Tax=Lutibacter sp. TaxID=1925666 RepID=UPI0017F93E94|nr:NTP transferase domain-containing protein [Lutibacter sp.]MBT8317256.1 NTP transferase domain-containing protein [Lutibacter sp.]NNJ58115.1 NTP transferase domain-containing protein [Lutibacter sp.]
MENNTVFVLLAGGKSERMGVDKGLLKYQHTFWILEQLNRISKTTIKTVYIGLGYHYENYFNAIPWLKKAVHTATDFQGLQINVIINQHPELGSFSTLKTVLQIIAPNCSILVSHIDIPMVNSVELQKIIDAKNTIVIPNFEGKNGHPIKMDTLFWKKLIPLKISDIDARLDFQIKKVNPSQISTITVLDTNSIRNLNTKKEWITYINNSNEL